MKVPKHKLEEFINTVRVQGSIDFPSIARKMQLKWHKDLLPIVDTDADFRGQLEDVLSEIKYDLLNRLLSTARNGKQPGSNSDISYVNAMIKHIDSGAVLGGAREEDGGRRAPTEEEVKAHLKRLNIKE